MRIYLESRFYGGAGGEEKLVFNILKTCPDNIQIDYRPLFFDKKNKFNFNNNIKLVSEPSDIEYDLGIRLGLLGDARDFIKGKFKKKILCPCGYEYSEVGLYNKNIYEYYDYIWKESPSTDNYMLKEVVICPPTLFSYDNPKNNSILEKMEEKKYYTTMANYYDIEIKGIDLIYEFAEISDYPIIWFIADNKNYCSFPEFKKPKNLKIAKNIPYNVIMDTIKNSMSYICFSRSEGFGFALSEAVLLQKPIITKKVGLVNYFPEDFNLFDKVSDINNIIYKNVDYSKYYKMFNYDFWEKIFQIINRV